MDNMKERLEKETLDTATRENPEKSQYILNMSFLDNPVDGCMVKSLFRKDDHLLKFYEQKYKFQPKDIRPFAQFDANNDTNTAHDDQMF